MKNKRHHYRKITTIKFYSNILNKIMNCYYNLKGLRNISPKISFKLHQNIKYDQMKQDTKTFISTSISTPNSFEHSIKTT